MRATIVTLPTKNDVSIMSNTSWCDRHSFERLRHVQLFHDAVVRHDGMEIAAEMDDLNAVLRRVRGSLRAASELWLAAPGALARLILRSCNGAFGVLENSIAEAGVAQI